MPVWFNVAGIALGLGLLIGADGSGHRAVGVLVFGLACFFLGAAFS